MPPCPRKDAIYLHNQIVNELKTAELNLSVSCSHEQGPDPKKLKELAAIHFTPDGITLY